MITVQVIAECRIGGALCKKGSTVDVQDEAEARRLSDDGYVDILKVDGKPAFSLACCAVH